MRVYLSHMTALLFWRAWSEALAIPLHTFHDMRKIDVRLLPASSYSSSSTLGLCTTSEKDVLAILRDCEADGAVTAALSSVVGPQALAEQQSLHVIVRTANGMRDSARVARHRSCGSYPRRSFIKVARNVYVCAPELVFLQLAPMLSRGALLALGYELCGCYPLAGKANAALVRRPLTSSERLGVFASQATYLKGAKIARVASKYVQSKSGSVMETELAILAFAPVSRGGLGLAPARLNESIALSARAVAATGLSRVVCDFLWPEARFAMEYDGHDSHATRQRQAHDSRKRDALLIDGIKLVTVTSSQFHHIGQCASLLDDAARRIGKPKRKRRAEHLPKHMELREQVRRYHRGFLP
ncbi:hypothetical protein [Adlercreutzia caecimuris]|uniref:hypothetical protein n=1 Tax=Adlercreutzia caecimuris TaxID=671266 RepID=UPI0024946C67|nr:hypothetical protein [Adlercreutzia caecimuris]